MKKIFLVLSGFALLFASCKPTFKADAPSANGLNFSNYVAIGNSLTAGYADGSLYRSGQMNSYPSMLHQQFVLVGGSLEFKQPLLPGESGWPGRKYVMGFSTDVMGVTSMGPVLYSGTLDTGANVASLAPFNNYGVHGIRAIDYTTNGYAIMNPYAGRILSNPFSNMLAEVKKNPATFFTMWLGSNDVLGYATSGGEGSPTIGSPNNISDVTTFKTVYDTVVKTMVANGAKGALMNIPDVTSIPYFTTIPANGLTLNDSLANLLNMAYTNVPGFNNNFVAGANYFVIQDPTVVAGFRQALPGELILLTVPQDSIRYFGWGSATPIPKKYVLDLTEIQNIKTATTTFNDYMQQQAIAHNLAYVDMNSFMKTLAKGMVFNGVTYSPTFVTGGAFSLDGVHLTPRGYAIAANEMIRVINAHYKSTIPMIDVNKFNGILFPSTTH